MDDTRSMTKHEMVTEQVNQALKALNELENSREKSLAITKLQEANHWIEDDRLRVHYAAGGR